eukprot:NODE_1008_length_1622_cov_8.839797_g833_i0.p1 GENE.NODE_1008_length_1622_cov_8.839797_g833_i0~~NODE_1008_length_1622_cov_8.839797_g833_i0.p1  ORF type:complete len:470 (-),score=68.99 NODE_1008_length_1622_cov_8.839797_g833_i0:44-1453(-)
MASQGSVAARTAVASRPTDRFLMKGGRSDVQYYPFYTRRAATLRPFLEGAAISQWGKKFGVGAVSRIVDIAGAEQTVVLVGTIFKECKEKPNFLKDYIADAESGGQELVQRDKFDVGTRFADATSDTVVLEDDSGRTTLQLDAAAAGRMVTGIVVAILGVESADSGTFVVEGLLFPGTPHDTIPRSPSAPESFHKETSRFVGLLSGLSIPGEKVQTTEALSLSLLLDFLAGELGNESAQIAARIGRIVVAGNLVDRNAGWYSCRSAHLTAHEGAEGVRSAQAVDDFLDEIAAMVPLDVMPGANDLSTSFLPQQPLHPLLFPKTFSREGTKFVTNPYATTFDGQVRSVGLSGETLDDVLRYSTVPEHCENSALWALESLLDWRLLAPTCPDTLPLHPAVAEAGEDPFVLKQIPDLLFSGGSTSGFATKRINRTRLVAVPAFAQDPVLVLVDISQPSLPVHSISLRAASSP